MFEMREIMFVCQSEILLCRQQIAAPQLALQNWHQIMLRFIECYSTERSISYGQMILIGYQEQLNGFKQDIL
jgi:hypothetical protein